MNELDDVLRKLDDLNRVPGRDAEAVCIDRCHLLEDGFRLLVEKIRIIEESDEWDW